MKIIDVYDQGERIYQCIDTDDYKPVRNPNGWRRCPQCGQKPLIWIFDNGAYCACGCGNQYDKKFKCESINSRYSRNSEDKTMRTEDILMDEWNHFCDTGENLFEKKKAELAKQDIKIW